MKLGIHFFRKDLRIIDNFALNELATKVDRIIGLFVFDSAQIKQTKANKHYYSIHAAQFIIDSVNDLNKQCNNKLTIMDGNPVDILESLIKSSKPIAVSYNADFSPYALKRDKAIQQICKTHNVETIINNDDQTLAPMESLLKKDKTPYMVYGTFFKTVMKQTIAKPTSKRITWMRPLHKQSSFQQKSLIDNATWLGGRTEALYRLKSRIANGATDKVAQPTSELSAYMNQGCISIREVYWTFKSRFKSIEPIRSIVWRDFFLCIYRFHPRGNGLNHIDERYDSIKWPKVKESEWKLFESCNTGFILVDAAMRELQETGFINNRCRLILATFWIKYLMIDPFDPEYGSQAGYSRLLIDCSGSQNKLSHQWVIGDLDLSGRRFAMRGTPALTGRSMRIDNDTIKRYDPQFEYIKKWMPEFTDLSIKECKDKIKKTKPMYEWKVRYQQYAKLFK